MQLGPKSRLCDSRARSSNHHEDARQWKSESTGDVAPPEGSKGRQFRQRGKDGVCRGPGNGLLRLQRGEGGPSRVEGEGIRPQTRLVGHTAVTNRRPQSTGQEIWRQVQSVSQGKTKTLRSHLSVESGTKEMNEPNRNRPTDREQAGGCQRGAGMGDWVRPAKEPGRQIGSYRTALGCDEAQRREGGR